MTMESLPSILFQIGEEDVGDIEYLSRIEFGDLVGASLVNFDTFVTKTSLGSVDTIVGTVPAGKDWYITTVEYEFTSDIAINGTSNLQIPSGTIVVPSKQTDSNDLSTIRGLKLTPGQTIVINQNVTFFSSGRFIQARVRILLVQVDTGTSPKLT